MLSLKQEGESENEESDEKGNSQSVFTPKAEREGRQSSGAKSNHYQNQETLENLENDTSSSPEPLSSRLEGERLRVYMTENMNEKDTETPERYPTVEGRNFHIVGENSGDKPPTSERGTVVEDPDVPSIEFTQIEEETKSITEFD